MHFHIFLSGNHRDPHMSLVTLRCHIRPSASLITITRQPLMPPTLPMPTTLIHCT
jgi:hypothetical protein